VDDCAVLMQDLDVKRGHWKSVDLAKTFEEHFGKFHTEEGAEGTWYVASGPAMKSFRVCLKDKAKVLVDIEEDRSASMDDAGAAIRIKNAVLLEITGFTAKQRAKRAQDAAKKAEA
jgi:hypothetical protein